MIEGLPLWVASTNAWIVAPSGPGRECLLVDAPPDPMAIVQRLKEHDLRLVALLATHGHVDHIGGVSEVVSASGSVPVRIHDADRHMLLDPVGAAGTLGWLLEAEGLDLRPPELVAGLDDEVRVLPGHGLTTTVGEERRSNPFLTELQGR